MSNAPSCVLYPEAPNGESSRMYKDLLKEIKDRPIVNYLYASYKASNIEARMEQTNKYQKNSQGEYNANDVLDFIQWSNIQSELASLHPEEFRYGFVDSNGVRVDFTDATDALRKAEDFNNNHKGLIATVVQHGDIFNINVYEKNSRTHTYGDSISAKLQIWDVYKQVLNVGGVNIEAMPSELASTFNAYNNNLARHIRDLVNTDISNLYRKDALTLLSLSPNSPHVQRAINAFGSIENAAQALDDFNHGYVNITRGQQTLLIRAINDAKKLQNIDIDVLIDQVDQLNQNITTTSPEENIKQELHRLNKKYKIDINEIHRISKEVNTLSDAVADAILTLQRQIRKLEKEKGNNAEGKRLEQVLNTLMKELAAKKYYSGIINFLNEATTQIKGNTTSQQLAGIDKMLQDISTATGTKIEIAFNTAKILQQIQDLKNQYYPLISALEDKTLTIDESISQVDIDNFRTIAKELKEYFDSRERLITNLTETNMINLMTEIVGDKTPDGQSMINAIKMASADSSLFDYLYSIGRASNPIIGAMGSIIRNAQLNRDKKINSISLRLRRITDALYKAGYDTTFMYESDSHIASDIDWNLYKEARKKTIRQLYSRGLRGFDLKQAIEDWEDNNTEDRVVDNTNGRTERVPNQSYRKNIDFQNGWSQAQKDYYKEAMQLKGEIGSLLPAYAQHQYLPPQVRRNFLDAINDGDYAKALKNKFQDFYKVREDDENYNTNGIIDGDEYRITEGAFDNTPLRQIPIFFINEVEAGELLKNFSSGLSALAGTAINYEAMNEIVDVVEFIGDFAKNQVSRDKLAKGDVVQNKEVRVIKDLWNRSKNTNTEKLIEGFISQYIYGQKIDPNENKKFSKIFGNILAYTSFKGLATNLPGAMANYLMGEFQMLIEAGAGEFYGFKDYVWAHSKLIGNSGVGGDLAELLTNNINHKGVFFRELFDPLQDNFTDKSHKKYYRSAFRQLVSHDCSFIGYSSGEYLIHYVNMYAILHNKKVLLNNKKICLYDAFEVVNKQDGNSELRLKQGVTDLDGNAITNDYIDKVRDTIRYANQTTHGSMNADDKGLIHQKWWGRGIMNFRQWMVEHYSRRFRKRHFDASLGMEREGYWRSLITKDTKDLWEDNKKKDALLQFMRDMWTFTIRAQSQWSNLDEMQKNNVKRVKSEMMIYIALLGLSFALGEPDEHKKEFWRRFFIYQIKRMILETEASMPHPKNFSNWLTIMNSPMAPLNTMNAFMYTFYGLTNGDITTELKSGPHKGENKYWRNFKKYNLPVFKDIEKLQNMDSDDTEFKIFETTPSNR